MNSRSLFCLCRRNGCLICRNLYLTLGHMDCRAWGSSSRLFSGFMGTSMTGQFLKLWIRSELAANVVSRSPSCSSKFCGPPCSRDATPNRESLLKWSAIISDDRCNPVESTLHEHASAMQQLLAIFCMIRQQLSISKSSNSWSSLVLGWQTPLTNLLTRQDFQVSLGR